MSEHVDVKVGLILLDDYESWIRSLGFDREWQVQASQADLYRRIMIESARVGAFTVPLTYDSYAVVLDSVDTGEYGKLVRRVSRTAPVELRALIGTGTTYVEALTNARELGQARREGGGRGATVVVHADLNGYYGVVKRDGPYSAYTLMAAVAARVGEISSKCGGLAHYAGGDNVICFVPRVNLERFLTAVTAGEPHLKLGVGVGANPREALKLAAEALEAIRSRRESGHVVILRSSGP